MLKGQAAIRRYERRSAERIADLVHEYRDSLTEPAAVYAVPMHARAQQSVERSLIGGKLMQLARDAWRPSKARH